MSWVHNPSLRYCGAHCWGMRESSFIMPFMYRETTWRVISRRSPREDAISHRVHSEMP